MANKRKKILIHFDGAHLAYSPTVIQLYDHLSKEYEVTILAYDPQKVTNQRLPGRNVHYYSFPTGSREWINKVLFRLLTFVNKNAALLRKTHLGYNTYFCEYLLLKKELRRNDYCRLIAVDTKNLFLFSLLHRHVDFLSLELCKDEHLIPLIDTSIIDAVLIQREDRKTYLFKDRPLRAFYVQNAPAYKPIKAKTEKRGLIFSGTAWNAFGFYHCLDYLRAFPDEKMTVQGVLLEPDRERVNAEYKPLLDQERLVINTSYLLDDEVTEYISHYELGFCFYNFDVPWIDNHNYRTAPSGKLFKYLAAGVPVVGIDIPGFDFIREFDCGILIGDLSPETIRKAVTTIRAGYAGYSARAIEAAKYFSFDKAIGPYLDHLREICRP